MNNRFLIIAPYQFGELSDCYYWAKYATIKGMDVTYIGYKYKRREIKERSCPGVKIKSVLHFENRYILGFVFYIKCILEILLRRHNNVIICYMPMCQLLPKIFPNRNIILDVRTLSVSNNKEERKRQDAALIRVKKSFGKCSVISEGVGQKIGAPYFLLPLGAEPLSTKTKVFDVIKLFYIGTLDNRDLSKFVKGLALFQKKTGKFVSFDIVGVGSNDETNKIVDMIHDSGAQNVRMHGYLNHDEAKKFFDECNVGVCFVPITEYYQYQPPTKLYEYLLSGMVAISTNTISNSEVMTDTNGVVINDTPESVCEGLEKILKDMKKYSSKQIEEGVINYHWSNIVSNNLLPLIVN